MIKPSRIFLIFVGIVILSLMARYGCEQSHGTSIKPADYVTIAVRTIYNTGGVALPDSVRILVLRNGTELHDAWYNTADAQASAIDSVLVFTDQLQDINGAGGAGHYVIMGRAYDKDSTLYTPFIYNFDVGLLDTAHAANVLNEAIKAKTDNLPSDPADDSDIDAQLVAIDNYVDTEVAAIKAKTDNLPTDPADQSLLMAEVQNLNGWNPFVNVFSDSSADSIELMLSHRPVIGDTSKKQNALTFTTKGVEAAVKELDEDSATIDLDGTTIGTVTNVTNEVSADMVKISGDGTAADNLETMLDGTGGQILSLRGLHVRATQDGDTAVIMKAVPGGLSYTGTGLYIGGPSGASAGGHGLVIKSGTTGDGAHIIGTEDGIEINNGGGAGASYDIELSGDGEFKANIVGTIDSADGVARVTDVTNAVDVDTGKIGRSVWDNDIVSQANRTVTASLDSEEVARSVWDDDVTAQANRTVTSVSCAGWGSRLVIIRTFDASDSSTGIAGVTVIVFDSTNATFQAGVVTNASGICSLSLDDHQYCVHLKKTPHSITSPVYPVISSDTTLTYYVTTFDPGAPPSADKCRLWTLITDFSGFEYAGAKLLVHIPDDYYVVRLNADTSTVVTPYSLFGISNDTGYVYVDCYESGEMVAGDETSTVKYDLSLVDRQGRVIARKRNYEVPDSTSHKIIW